MNDNTSQFHKDHVGETKTIDINWLMNKTEGRLKRIKKNIENARGIMELAEEMGNRSAAKHHRATIRGLKVAKSHVACVIRDMAELMEAMK